MFSPKPVKTTRTGDPSRITRSAGKIAKSKKGVSAADKCRTPERACVDGYSIGMADPLQSPLTGSGSGGGSESKNNKKRARLLLTSKTTTSKLLSPASPPPALDLDLEINFPAVCPLSSTSTITSASTSPTPTSFNSPTLSTATGSGSLLSAVDSARMVLAIVDLDKIRKGVYVWNRMTVGEALVDITGLSMEAADGLSLWSPSWALIPPNTPVTELNGDLTYRIRAASNSKAAATIEL